MVIPWIGFPLAHLSVGLYGKTLPAQNGAPIRLVVPWKYGFYANVNPEVSHPRWSQASERRLTTGGLLTRNRIDTLPFNGYDEVAKLYTGMDLRKNF